MGNMAPKKDPWVRCFDVCDPRKHPKGYTVYKVTYKIFSRETTDLVEEIVIWKRYNDFKRLYQTLCDWHKKMHRKEEFPVFAKATVFGRFEDAVIEERRHAAFELLVFLGRQAHLHSHESFIRFFQGGERQDPNKAFENTCPLEPDRVGSPSQEISTDSLSASDAGSYQDDPVLPTTEAIVSTNVELSSQKPVNILGGVWKYRQSTENISLDSNGNDDDDDADDDDEEEDVQTDDSINDLPENDLSFFDPLNDINSEESKPNQISNMWLLSAMSVCADLENKSAQPSPQHFPVSYSRDNLNDDETVVRVDPHNSVDSFKRVKISNSVVDGPSPSMTASFDSKMTIPKPKLNRTLSEAMMSIITKDRTVSGDSVTYMDVGGHLDYICRAASQISMAKECEANANNDMAFRYYKTGVAILLEGVQNDSNKARREAVRRKTAQYLLKAEDLYNRYLAPEITDHKRWGTESRLSPTLERDTSISHLRGPISELRNYRVLGVVDKVMLVLDKISNQTYIMKSVHKSSSIFDSNKCNIVPTFVPFMVKLHKFYETESSLFLLLEHATGGKLWNYINAYLQLHREPDMGMHYPSDDPSSNIYSGQKVIVACSPNSLPSYIETTLKSEETIAASELPDQVNKCESSNELECSDSYAQFMTEYRKESMTDDINELNVTFSPDSKSDVKADKLSIKSAASDIDLVGNVTKNDGNQPVLTSPETGEPVTSSELRQNRLNSSFSSVDEEHISAGDVDFKISANAVSSPKFSEVLNGTKVSSELENFSIYSFDSEHHRSSSDIPDNGFTSPLPTLDDVDDDDGDGVFGEKNKPRLSFDELLDDMPDSKSLKTRTVRLPSTEELVNNARKLLSSVSETLGEVIQGTTERQLSSQSDDVFVGATNDSVSLENVLDSNNKLDNNNVKEDGDLPNLERSLRSTNSPCKIDTSGFKAVSDFKKEKAVTIDDYLEDTSKQVQQSFDKKDTKQDSREKVDVAEETRSLNTFSDIKNADENLLLLSVKVSQLPDSKNANFELKSPPSKSGSLSSNSGDQILGSHTDSSVSVSKLSKLSSDSAFKKRKDFKTHNSLSSESGSGRVRLQREQSLDRSLDSCSSKPRKRNFSSLFAQLDSTISSPDSSSVIIPENCVRQWAAEIVTCLSLLHSMGIVCRDLRPDNILLGERGHVLLTYFSEWSQVNHVIRPDAIEEYFTAPELHCLGEATPASDWWSFGAILYELLTCLPLASCHPYGFSSHTQLCIPDHLSKEATSLITELLRFNPSERLGSGVNGADDIKMHPFFHSITWLDLQGTITDIDAGRYTRRF